MVEFKIVIGQKDGKSVQKTLAPEESEVFMNKKIGEKINGVLIGFDGYEFEISGGSDFAGFPMRRDVEGTLKKKILAVEGVGLKKEAKGIRQRKTVAGNTIYEGTAQINLRIIKQGAKPLVEEAKPETEEEAKEEKSEENGEPKPEN